MYLMDLSIDPSISIASNVAKCSYMSTYAQFYKTLSRM